MRSIGWLCVVSMGCAAQVSEPETSLRVEPSTIELAIELGAPAPMATVKVFAVTAAGDQDVTAAASFTLDGAQLGVLDGPSLASDGLTGGVAMLRVDYDQAATAIPVTAHVHELRVVAGTPAGAEAAFAAATPTPIDAHLDPADGAVMPPDLGRVEVAFAAADLDDAHELRVTAPYLDLDIFAPGAAGPREIDLTSNEWAAIGHTARGGEIAVAVGSLQSSAPAAARVATETLAIADTDPSALLVSGIYGGALPAMWRFDPHAGAAAPLFANPAGACLGCHLAVSADGTRISASMFVAGQTVNGVVLDANDGTVLAQSDPTSASPWFTAAFDPNGSLVGAYQGALSLRDGTSGAPMAAISTGEAASAPAISPDGTALAYVTLDAGMGPGASQPVGNALHVRPWNAATATVGAPIELVRDGGGVVLPVFSSDGRWIAFGHSANTEVPVSSSAVRSDGSGTSVMLTSDPLDQLAHWASPIAPARAGHRAAEPMVWIAFVSTRPVGGNATSLQQLWLEAFYPDRGVVMPAFHLPGQPATLQVLHGPLALP